MCLSLSLFSKQTCLEKKEVKGKEKIFCPSAGGIYGKTTFGANFRPRGCSKNSPRGREGNFCRRPPHIFPHFRARGRKEESGKKPPPLFFFSPFGTNGQKRRKKRPFFLLFAFFRTPLFFFVAALKKIDGIVYPMGEEKRVFFTCPLPTKDRHPPRAEEMSCLKTARSGLPTFREKKKRSSRKFGFEIFLHECK